MASIFSVSAVKGSSVGCLTRLCKVPKCYNVTQVAFIKRLAIKENLAKPSPFPYWKTECNRFSMLLDPSSLRFDENSKLIVVDGPPAVGKTKLCETIAEQFGFLYMPSPTHEEIYVNVYGFNTCSLDPQLPASCQSYDLPRYLQNPMHPQVPTFQLEYHMMRFEQYLNALIHVLATGQGVVLNKSIYTNAAYNEAMLNAGYLNKKILDQFNLMNKNTFEKILRPHLVVYLDAPPNVTLENIKRKGKPDEVNSKVFTTSYLSDLEKAIKEKCLTWLSSHTHILIYDWSKKGNYLDIIHDIEALDLEEYEDKDKLQDWIFLDKADLIYNLNMFQNKYYMFSEMLRPAEDIFPPELYRSPEDDDVLKEVLMAEETEKYAPGCNPNLGDSVFLVNTNPLTYSCRRTPKDFVNCDLFKLY